MADIKIERKERSPWVWLIALAALALLAWFIVNSVVGRRDVATLEARGGDVAAVEAAPAAVPGAVSEYLQFADGQQASDAMGLDHDYTARGLTQLAAAIGAIAVQDTVAGGALQPQLDEIRQRATALQQEPTATAHALQTREAFMIAASLIENMRERRFPNLAAESAGVTDAAKAIQAERPLLDQKSEVQQFFGRAAAALRGMTTAS